MGLAPRDDRTNFRGLHDGETIYVVASGASLDFIKPEFFRDKTVVAVNYIGRELGLEHYYMCSHYHLDAIAMSAEFPDLPIIVPEVDQGGNCLAPHPPEGDNVWSFPTNPQQYAGFDVDVHWPTEPDSLPVGPTSLHFAMAFAAYLGAATIILAGADCGTLDGRENRTGHDRGIGPPFPVWEDFLPRVADRVRRQGVAVHSLNPFVTPALEGHSYHSPACTIN